MSSAVVEAWTACIDDLQQLIDGSSPGVELTPARLLANEACRQRVINLKQQPPVPYAAFIKLVQDVQVTSKLAALYCKAVQISLQQTEHLTGTLGAALETWLATVTAAVAASPACRAAAAVRQQLQESQLLQHLAAGMDAAASRLTFVAASAPADGDSNSASSSTVTTPEPGPEPEYDQGYTQHMTALHSCCASLLKTFRTVTCVLAPSVGLLAAALPAAPAALRLSLAVFQTNGKLEPFLQQEWELLQEQQLPSMQFLPVHCRGTSTALQAVPGVVLLLAIALGGDVASTLQACPAVSELLLSPNLLSCLAIMMVVTVLGLDTSSWDGAAAAPASGSSTGMGSSTVAGSQQQEQQTQHTGSSSSGGNGHSNGVQLDSLTPLSCSLFDMLGVSKETALQAVRLAKAEGTSTLPDLAALAAEYNLVLRHHVDQVQVASLAQLLRQLETDMLLRLMLLQLTASIPTVDSHPRAKAARDLACQLRDPYALLTVWNFSSMHPLPATEYAGPQLAMQLLRPPHVPQQPASELPQQQQQQQQQQQRRRKQHEEQLHLQPQPQQQQQQLVQGCVAAPTAALLADLLPLLTHHSLTQLQQLQEQLQQQQEQLLQQQQQLAALSTVQALTEAARVVIHYTYFLSALLLCSVVPAPCTTAPAAADVSLPPTASPTASAAAPTAAGHSYVLHAQDVLMPYAVDSIRVVEAALRCQATLCDLAHTAAVKAGVEVPANSSGGGAAAAAAASGRNTSSADDSAQVCSTVYDCAELLFTLCRHKVSGDPPHLPSPLVLLALAAGAGSQVQRQLHSLLATVAKLGGRKRGTLGTDMWVYFRAPAPYAASALLAAASEKQQQQQLAGAAGEAVGATYYGSSLAGSGDMLPLLVILGRCCIQRAEKMQDDPDSMFCFPCPQDSCSGETQQEQQEQQQQQQQEEDDEEERSPGSQCESEQLQELEGEGLECDIITLLSVVQQWLAAGSTCEQLTAAGYAPLHVLQQLEQMAASWQALQDIAGVPAVAQQLQFTGLALCSFAVPCMCNNPGCTSIVGLSELAAVSGRSCVCAGCLVARYCGRACQRAAWKQHKPVCGALSAAVAAASGTGAGDPAA